MSGCSHPCCGDLKNQAAPIDIQIGGHMRTLLFLCLFLNPLFGETLSLDGRWFFQSDPQNSGLDSGWMNPAHDCTEWRDVTVPHTWQVDPGFEDYFGVAWYRRSFSLDALPGSRLKLEFDAIYRDATVWVNGKMSGEHTGSGWTPFSLDAPVSKTGTYEIIIRVDNRFSEKVIPWMDSFDWANDGGIIRSVRLHILPASSVQQMLVSAKPAENLKEAIIQCKIRFENPAGHRVRLRIFDPSGNLVAQDIRKGKEKIDWVSTVKNPDLWHFDIPRLYRLQSDLIDKDQIIHSKSEIFGIYSIEVRDGYYWLNGEPMRLMGVEWMPGSDPRYGMAESPETMRGILEDMKRLNCIITRFHWQQDRSVFEFCDRNGMLLQEEVPTWGPRTQLAELHGIQEQHMREMIPAHFNHPSIYAWGLCNEISGHGSEGHAFVSNGVRIARELDPGRLLTYASNQLQHNAGLDASSLVDFVEWNDYYESWYRGDLNSLEENLKTIEAAFPDKSLVISEYGLCECSPDNPIGDPRRIEILQTHTDMYRKFKQVAGAIFFDYNDYRTHIGDKGHGAYKQRVHGVVDVLGRRKPSWEILRQEMSPVKRLEMAPPKKEGKQASAAIVIVTRSLQNDMPAYTLRNYDLLWTAYNQDNQPIEGGRFRLPDLTPGTRFQQVIKWPAFDKLKRIQVALYRPTGYSVIDDSWDIEGSTETSSL